MRDEKKTADVGKEQRKTAEDKKSTDAVLKSKDDAVSSHSLSLSLKSSTYFLSDR